MKISLKSINMVSFSLVAVYDTGECFYFQLSISFLLKSACVPTMYVSRIVTDRERNDKTMLFLGVCAH